MAPFVTNKPSSGNEKTTHSWGRPETTHINVTPRLVAYYEVSISEAPQEEPSRRASLVPPETDHHAPRNATQCEEAGGTVLANREWGNGTCMVTQTWTFWP